MKAKVITVLGPTAIGKSDIAVDIAIYLKEKYNIESEIISADSRQVYKKLDIGTGKITKEEMRGVKHHMLDIVYPDQEYSVYKYHKDAKEIINKIIIENKIPIICGGTGLYIDALLFDCFGNEVKPNNILREKLEKINLENLQTELNNLSKKYNIDISHIDIKNKRRIIRAIEIITELKKLPPKNYNNEYENLIIGLNTDYDFLKGKIYKRIEKRLDQGMIEEVENLLKQKEINHEKLQKLGLEYRFISEYLTGVLTKKDFIEKLYFAICHYAKRQKTWFFNDKNLNKKDNKIYWFDIQDKDYKDNIFNLICEFIK